MKRIFVAVDISAEVRQRAAFYIENLKRRFSNLRVGWERPEKLHLTLKFLGEIGDSQLASLKEAAREAAGEISNIQIEIAGTGVFPNPRRARVLWLGINDAGANLQKLNAVLENEAERFGFAREERDFKAHLTIARLREPGKAAELVKTHLEENFAPVEFIARELVIYESLLLPSGSRYEVISKHAFGR